MTLQEDERSRLARELHDEFGQRLTALRVDAAWLGKRVAADDAALHEVVRGMSEHCAELQRDIRGLLARLRPLGSADGDDERPTLDRLAALLRALLDGWAASAAAHASTTRWCCCSATRRREQALDERDAARLAMPRELMLGIYRLSQEALTNVARHAHARAASSCGWSSSADATGRRRSSGRCATTASASPTSRSAMKQGSGLGGMRERVWALGGELQCATAARAAADSRCRRAQLERRDLSVASKVEARR